MHSYKDPYHYYHDKRQQTPVYQDEEGTWFLTNHDDVKLLLADPRFTRQLPTEAGFLNQQMQSTLLDKVISKWLVLNDPPHHTHLRQALSELFNPTRMKSLQTHIEKIANDLLINLPVDTEVDFMQAFSYPLPVQVINHLLGTELNYATIRQWAISLATALDHASPDDFMKISADVLEMQTYFAEVISGKIPRKSTGWIDEMYQLVIEGKMSEDELIPTCIFLMLAGHETVQLTIGLGLRSLLQHPAQLKLLQSQPELVANAVEEMLRYDSPLNKISRWTSETTTFGDVTIPKNKLVVGLLNAANRDPQRYNDPDKFDITRQNNRHLTFGVGIHNCLGALLARIELRAAFVTLIPHLHRFTLLDDRTEWLPNTSFRYLYRLPISIGSE